MKKKKWFTTPFLNSILLNDESANSDPNVFVPACAIAMQKELIS